MNVCVHSKFRILIETLKFPAGHITLTSGGAQHASLISHVYTHDIVLCYPVNAYL